MNESPLSRRASDKKSADKQLLLEKAEQKRGLSPRKTRYVCLPFGFEGSGGDVSPVDKRDGFIFPLFA